MSPADIEAARVRARRRMIGMAVLVVLGVIGFPWLFETQPRPLPADIAVVNASSPPAAAARPVGKPPVQPSKPSSLPVVVANAQEAEAIERHAEAAAASVTAEREASQGPEEVFENEAPAPVPRSLASRGATPKAKRQASPSADADQAESHAQAKVKQDAKLRAQAEAKARVEAKAKVDAKAKAEALAKAKLKSESVVAKADPRHAASKPSSTPADTRYIVQIGAFGDPTTAHEARMKVERLGIKTYTHEIGAGATRKIRVRVGPYASKAEADKAMTALRRAGLGGALLTL